MIFVAIAFLWLLTGLLALLATQHRMVWGRPAFVRQTEAVVLVILGCCCLLALSGCGTVPWQAQTSPLVPAGLLTPPRPPVLLKPASPSTMPGTTTPATPRPALTTGWLTSA